MYWPVCWLKGVGLNRENFFTENDIFANDIDLDDKSETYQGLDYFFPIKFPNELLLAVFTNLYGKESLGNQNTRDEFLVNMSFVSKSLYSFKAYVISQRYFQISKYKKKGRNLNRNPSGLRELKPIRNKLIGTIADLVVRDGFIDFNSLQLILEIAKEDIQDAVKDDLDCTEKIVEETVGDIILYFLEAPRLSKPKYGKVVPSLFSDIQLNSNHKSYRRESLYQIVGKNKKTKFKKSKLL